MIQKIIPKILIINFWVIISAIALDLISPYPPFSDLGFVSLFSFFQLLLIAYLSRKIFLVFNPQNDKNLQFIRQSHHIWKIFYWGFLFLAFDEILSIHENIDLLIHFIFRIEETQLSDRIDDFLVVVYTIFGILLVFPYRYELKRYRSAFPLWLYSFFLLCFSIIFDSISNGDELLNAIFEPQIASVLYHVFSYTEESCKLFAESGLILGFNRCLQLSKKFQYDNENF